MESIGFYCKKCLFPRFMTFVAENHVWREKQNPSGTPVQPYQALES
jgi:hypothetical protein